MTNKRSAWAAVVAASLLAAVPAAGQIAGFKITEPMVDDQTQKVHFDVVAYSLDDTPPTEITAGRELDTFRTSTFYVQTADGGPGTAFHLVIHQWNTNNPPAIEFGDGDTQQMMTLALDVAGPPNTFRGSFTHSYSTGNYDIRARLTPDGQVTRPGIETSNLTTGTAITGDLFKYIYTRYRIRTPDGQVTSSGYFYTSRTYLDTVRYVVNEAQVQVLPPSPVMSVIAGVCPGIVSLKIGNLEPGDKVALYTSDTPGETVLSGTCAGTVVDLEDAFLRTNRFADRNGEIVITRNFPPAQCSLLMQAVNLGVGGNKCTTSNVLAAPSAVNAFPRFVIDE